MALTVSALSPPLRHLPGVSTALPCFLTILRGTTTQGEEDWALSQTHLDAESSLVTSKLWDHSVQLLTFRLRATAHLDLD